MSINISSPDICRLRIVCLRIHACDLHSVEAVPSYLLLLETGIYISEPSDLYLDPVVKNEFLDDLTLFLKLSNSS
jgi:hypothetical protein